MCRSFYARWSGLGLALLALAVLAGCNSWDCRALNGAGVRQVQQGRYQVAMAKFQEAIQKDPKDPDGYYNMAYCYYQLGLQNHRQEDFNQAERLYNACLDRAPDHVECHRGLAVLLAEENRKEEAFRLLERWIDRNPTSADAKVELARLMEEMNRPKEAREQLSRALELAPTHSRALAASARLREQSGDTQEALALYQRSLESNPSQPEVAARVASLRGTAGLSAPPGSPAGDTRIVGRSTGTTLR
ncbi:MAG: tetratricopeptide repeat protein [Pirellulales bacterium]|nr:tetratricopeptide repeat protein [Pirellulales bacterium]